MCCSVFLGAHTVYMYIHIYVYTTLYICIYLGAHTIYMYILRVPSPPKGPIVLCLGTIAHGKAEVCRSVL